MTACKEYRKTESIQLGPAKLYKLHQNGMRESSFQTLFEKTRAILYNARLLKNSLEDGI